MAVILTITVGVAGTIAGALIHTETRQIDGDVEYHLYGWPWDWKTDASTELIRFQRDNAINYRYNDSGFAPNVFLFTIAVWSIAALTAEGITVIAAWRLRWFLRNRTCDHKREL